MDTIFTVALLLICLGLYIGIGRLFVYIDRREGRKLIREVEQLLKELAEEDKRHQEAMETGEQND